ncbi:hypothetical protein AB9F97_000246 [Escherichia coli]
MIMLKKMLSLLLLGCLISQSFFCVAETYGLPELREQQFSLTDTGQIAAEIITGDILSKVDKTFLGLLNCPGVMSNMRLPQSIYAIC